MVYMKRIFLNTFFHRLDTGEYLDIRDENNSVCPVINYSLWDIIREGYRAKSCKVGVDDYRQ